MEDLEKQKQEVVETTFDGLDFEKDDSGSIYDQIYFVKIRTKNAAYFEFTRKDGDKILKDPRKHIQNIDGKVSKISLDSYTFENQEIKTFRIHISKELNNKNCLFIVSSSYTRVGRSIINSLLGWDKPIEKINLSLYLDAKAYPSVKTLINKEKATWKYSIPDQRKKIETIKNKKGEFVSNDYTDLDEMFEEKLRQHLGILLPEMDAPKIIDDVDETEVNDESVFGTDESDDASDFFDIDVEK